MSNMPQNIQLISGRIRIHRETAWQLRPVRNPTFKQEGPSILDLPPNFRLVLGPLNFPLS